MILPNMSMTMQGLVILPRAISSFAVEDLLLLANRGTSSFMTSKNEFQGGSKIVEMCIVWDLQGLRMACITR